MIVTGGARGIGAATAKLAATGGYAVCVNYLNGRDAAEEVVRETTARKGSAIAVHADVSSEAAVVELFEQVDARLGPVSAVVNNAATIAPQMRLDAMEAARIERMFAVNVLGSMLCAREGGSAHVDADRGPRRSNRQRIIGRGQVWIAGGIC